MPCHTPIADITLIHADVIINIDTITTYVIFIYIVLIRIAIVAAIIRYYWLHINCHW